MLRPLFFAAAVFCLTPLARSDNWTGYRGDGSGRSSESISQSPSATGQLKTVWKTPSPLGFSSFAVADDQAITLIAADGREICVAMSVDDGSEIWRTPLGTNQYKGGGGDAGAPGNRGGDGPRGTPTISGDCVLVYDAHLVLWCLDAANGSVRWKHDVVAENAGRNIQWSNATSPVVTGGKVFVGGGGPGETFLAFEIKTGQLLWKSGDEQLTHSTPVAATVNGKSQIVFWMQSGLLGIDTANGQELWRANFPYSTSTAASPVISGNYIYCSAGYGVGAGLFEITASGKPKEIWFEPNQLMNHWSTPIIKDGRLYGIFGFKKYGRAPLQCIDLLTGKEIWSKDGFGPGNCILVGDDLVVLSDAGEVAIVPASPDGYRELARGKVIDGKCWSTPAFADGRIFVRSTEQAACVEFVGNR